MSTAKVSSDIPLSNEQGKDTNDPGINPQIEFQDFIDDANKQTAGDGTPDDEITGEQLLLADVKEIPCLLQPFLQKVGLACLAGSSDTGKSTILRQLAIAVATGSNDFLGFGILANHKSVIYVSTEDDKDAVSFLLARQAGNYMPPQLSGLRFIFETQDLLAQLHKKLTTKPADLVIIDCFSDAYGGDLKDTQRIRTYLHPFQELAQKHQCLILFLHHTGKRTENLEPSKNNLLSGQGFEAKMRLVIELRTDLMNPTLRHLCIVKGNYLPSNCKKESYVLKLDEESFTFSNTGERMPYEFLAKQQNEDSGKAKYEEACKLKDQGLNYDKIAETIGYRSRGSVSKLFDKAKEKGWDNGVSSGNEEETKEKPESSIKIVKRKSKPGKSKP